MNKRHAYLSITVAGNLTDHAPQALLPRARTLAREHSKKTAGDVWISVTMAARTPSVRVLEVYRAGKLIIRQTMKQSGLTPYPGNYQPPASYVPY